jgi:hypothetical protein
MDWNAVAMALETAAKTTGINAIDFVPDSLPDEMFYVGEMDITMDVTFRRNTVDGNGHITRVGTDQGMITCRILVARSTDKYAVRKMRSYMAGSGPTAVAEAIMQDKTLGGTVHSSQLKRLQGNRLFEVGMGKFYGVEMDIFVIGAA